jgi:preprotein translocase subunit SecE
MPLSTQQDPKKPMADEALEGKTTRQAESQRTAPPGRGGFFTVHKPGQGYWTRVGTGIGAGIIGLFFAQFLYSNMIVWSSYFTENRGVLLGVIAGVLVLYALLIWWLMNRSNNADFLIATDSEMKKVNWTTRKELIGSTRVVIVFMFLIAAILFLYDVLFGFVFYFLRVLEEPPLRFW